MCKRRERVADWRARAAAASEEAALEAAVAEAAVAGVREAPTARAVESVGRRPRPRPG